MNGKKNRNSILRYSNTSSKCNTCNKVLYNDEDKVDNPFKFFTNPLSYYKTKFQKKHFDTCSEPYKVSKDNMNNYYNIWDSWNDVKLSDDEIKQIEKICLITLDVMAERGLKLSKSSLLGFIHQSNPSFYYNGLDITKLIRQYKQIHNIKPSTDTETLVLRSSNRKISKAAIKLGMVVK